MRKGLLRFQESGNFHFITFSCYRRQAHFDCDTSRRCFEEGLEHSRKQFGFIVLGYVVMPEHVHILMSEPERGN